MKSLFIFSLLFGSMSLNQKANSDVTLEKRISLIEDKVKKRIPDLLQKISNKENQFSLFVFKKEQLLEVWQMKPQKIKLKTYPFTKYSGYLGPKNRQGDKQIPEGIYQIDKLNPNSQYYLSARINYPNDLDKKRGEQYKIPDMGGDIYIHGKNKTVGCIPIGDENMEEVFYILYKVGVPTPIILSPSRLPLPELSKMGLLPHDIYATKKYEEIKKSLLEISKPDL